MITEIEDLRKSAIEDIRDESEKEGYGMIKRLIADYHSGHNRFDRRGEKLVGFLSNDKIVAVCGLNIEPSDARLGRIRRLYVLKDHRNRGTGAKLVSYLINQAKTSFKGVVVNAGNLPVNDFYESIGFQPASGNESYTHILRF